MYDELVKRLRELASIPEHCENVADCGKCTKEEICLSFTNKRIIEVATQAADAIEALADRNVGKWIPVTERLPEEYTDVLCYYEYFRYGDYNCMFRTIDRGYYGNGRWGGEAGQGHKNKVLAWMPLPSPPAEE